MKKKLTVGVLSLSMVFTSTSLCFAAEGIDEHQIQAEHQADIVEMDIDWRNYERK